jgi:hypothetical protein
MDINEFTKQVQPRLKRSRLLKYKTEIAELKERGYTDQQIRDWLAKNDIDVTREAVRKFRKNHLAAAAAAAPGVAAPAPLTATAAVQPGEAATAAPEIPGETQAEKMRRRVREQQQEAQTAQFKHDKTGNNIKE